MTEDIEGIKIVDNFFTNECLEALKYRMLFAKYFDKTYDSYVAIDYYPTKDYLTDLIVAEIKNKFDVPEFIRGRTFLNISIIYLFFDAHGNLGSVSVRYK